MGLGLGPPTSPLYLPYISHDLIIAEAVAVAHAVHRVLEQSAVFRVRVGVRS